MLIDPARGVAPTRDAFPPGPPATTLAELLRSGPLAPDQAALIGFEAARLVERASRAGLPVRIDLTAVAVDPSATVRLLHACPFGAVEGSRAPADSWQAPEVRSGRAPSGRSLVWSLGVLLRAMLAAPLPGAPVDVAGTRLRAIARRATARDPRRRQSSVRQLAREIGAVLLDAAPELA